MDKIQTNRSPRVRKGYDERRGEIVEAAISLIGTHGYNAVTVQMLADRCSMTKAGWLHYFSSKEEMLLWLLDELEVQDTAVLAPIVMKGVSQGPEEAKAALMELLDTIVERFVGAPEISRFAAVLQCEAIDPAHPAHKAFRRRERIALDVYAQLLEGSSSAPVLLARHLHALMSGLVQQWLRDEGGFDVLAAWRQTSRAALQQAMPADGTPKSLKRPPRAN